MAHCFRMLSDRDASSPNGDELIKVDSADAVKATDDSSHGKENKTCRVLVAQDSPKIEQRHTEEETTTNPNHKLCYACKSPLAKSPELISIAGQAHMWHPECFMCSICCQPMDKYQTCHLYRGQIVCLNDYSKMKRGQQNRLPTKCARCRWPIGPSDWVRRAVTFVYHLACFNCDICFRQLNTGDQFTLDMRDGMPNSARLLCRYHFSIDDTKGRHLNAKNLVMKHNQAQESAADQHISCHLQSESSLFAGSFRLSHQSQQPTVRSPMSPGSSAPGGRSGGAEGADTIGASLQLEPKKPNDDSDANHPVMSPTNEDHMHLQHNMHYQHSSASSTSSLSSSSSPTSLVNPMMQATSSLILIHTANSAGTTPSPACMQASGSSTKSKRVRTTFTDDQLSILQTHFQIDSNPDGQDLERIATITGLSKRVTQVWFQNSRARQKKYLVKKKPSSIQGTSSNDLIHS